MHNHHYPIYTGDVKVKEGGDFSVTCTVHKSPIVWYRNGEQIESQDVYHNHANGSAYWSTLTVKNAQLRHKGKYQCTLDFPTSHYLNVEEEDKNQKQKHRKLSEEQIIKKAEIPTFVPDYEQKFSTSSFDDEYDDEERSNRKREELRISSEHKKAPTLKSELDEDTKEEEARIVTKSDSASNFFEDSRELPSEVYEELFSTMASVSRSNMEESQDVKSTNDDYEDEYFEEISTTTTMASMNLSTRAASNLNYIPFDESTNDDSQRIHAGTSPLAMKQLETFTTVMPTHMPTTTATTVSTTASTSTTAASTAHPEEFSHTPLPIESKGSE